MQSPLPRVVVLATGGTIAGVASSPDDDLGYRAAALPIDALLAGIDAAGVALEAEQVAQLDSKDMGFAVWRRLAERLAHHAARLDVTGIVVTHGTDTMEETAWFLERLLAPRRAIVLTGAMRPATSTGADGPRNLADAIAVAAASAVIGVVVVMDGAIHAAGEVRKSHPQRLDAMTSGDAGPIGTIAGGRVGFTRAVAPADAVGLAALPADPGDWPWVEIVTSAAGADGAVVGLLVEAGVAGLVVAGTGNARVHEVLEARLQSAIANGVAVLRSTRCLDGAALDAEGGDPPSLPMATGLTPAQARVELILRLLAARRRAEARS